MATFDELAKKHGNFSAPQCKVLVGTPGSAASSLKELSTSDFLVLSVAVSQSIDASSSAQLTILGDYSLEKSDFKTKYYDTLQPGTKIAIKLGYKTPETVFVGAINGVRTEFSANAVTVNITAMDAKVALMYNFDNVTFPENSTADKVVEKVLEPCKDYGTVTVKVGSDSKNIKLFSWVNNRDDIDAHQFVTQLAALTNSSFYTCGDKVNFVENVFAEFCSSSKTAPVKLGWGTGLMSFSVDIDISAQIGTVCINFKDENKVLSSATYSGDDIGGSGSLPGKTKGKIVSGRIVEKEDTLVKTKEQATAMAKSIYLRALQDYVKGSGQTVGIPDIQAGDAIELTGLGSKLNGRYFLNQVNHQFDAGGYVTSFTCNRAKI